MDLVAVCREEGRKQATEWLKGAIDAPNPYALMATGARNSAAPAIKAGVVSDEDFAELSAGDWLEMAGVRDAIMEAYWEKVGPMTHTKTPCRLPT